MGKSLGRERNFEEVCFESGTVERNIGREDEFRVSGGSEFQSRGPEKALLPSDDLTYGMKRTSESEDRVETECDGNKRCRLLICKCFVCENYYYYYYYKNLITRQCQSVMTNRRRGKKSQLVKSRFK